SPRVVSSHSCYARRRTSGLAARRVRRSGTFTRTSVSRSRRRSTRNDLAAGRRPEALPSFAHTCMRSVAVAVVHKDDVGRGAKLLFTRLPREAHLSLWLRQTARAQPFDEHAARRDHDPDLIADVAQI